MSRFKPGDVTDRLHPIASSPEGDKTWDGATWVGQLDESDLDVAKGVLANGEGFTRARFLVWSGDQPRGFVEAPVVDGTVDFATIRAEVAQLPAMVARADVPNGSPPISVVVCTRDRTEQLRSVLENLAILDYPNFEVLVVDNNPASGLTPPVVEAFAGANVRMISAAGQGLSIARNAALKAARYDIVAFTDDDVVVDRNWLTNLSYGFSRDERVACVCGMVPSAELSTPAQSYFDRRVGWARRCDPAVFALTDPPDDDPLFPLRVAQFGTGANFAVRRHVALDLGGFDEGLGIGSPAGGGEDIDMFVRVLLADQLLVREPSAVVWHRHRRTAEELEDQIYNYGLGLGAWIAKLLSRPRTLGMVLRRLGPGVNHLRGVTVVDQSDTVANDARLLRLDRHELMGVLAGPLGLGRGRIAGRSAAPLKTRTSRLMKAFDFRSDQMWGDRDNSIVAGRLAITAVVLGILGLLGTISVLPSFLLIVLVGAFVLGGPGTLALSWYASLPTSVLVPLVPALSLATCVLVVSGALMAGIYSPLLVLVGLTAATVIGGLIRCGYLARRNKVTAA